MADNSDGVPPDDEFQAEYRVFVFTLEVLADTPEGACEAMGNYNVPWELKIDVERAKYLVGRGYLTAEQEKKILAMVSALGDVPASVYAGPSPTDGNVEAMRHPAWSPLRDMAKELLLELRPVTARWLGNGN
ncbi:hypothetical protein HUS23_02130 [Ectothiorhodospiraceae bacterium 2226]|nr:hypothetical protein HUS23_02130 [Ectothiorhodospiraceae bacterium 2226]